MRGRGHSTSSDTQGKQRLFVPKAFCTCKRRKDTLAPSPRCRFPAALAPVSTTPGRGWDSWFPVQLPALTDMLGTGARTAQDTAEGSEGKRPPKEQSFPRTSADAHANAPRPRLRLFSRLFVPFLALAGWFPHSVRSLAARDQGRGRAQQMKGQRQTGDAGKPLALPAAETRVCSRRQ